MQVICNLEYLRLCIELAEFFDVDVVTIDTILKAKEGEGKMTLDEWAAEQCGVITRFQNSPWQYKYKNKVYHDRWTLTDARCREIVREHFKIETVWIDDASGAGWVCYATQPYVPQLKKTIAEAEIACIEAIRRTRDK